MIKRLRLKAAVTALAALAATGGLITGAPSASASGNCYHYGIAGYVQVFSGPGYTGDCFEWPIGTYTPFPSYISYNVQSMRSWAFYTGQSYWLGSNRYSDSQQYLGGIDYTNFGGIGRLSDWGR